MNELVDGPVTVHVGDALGVLRQMPAESVHCVVTSPPYWGLRDYGASGQLGLEATPAEYVAKVVEIFGEVRRVLRRDGTCWLNIADSFAGSWGAQSRGGPPSEASTLHGNGHVGGGPKLKSLSATQIANHPKRGSQTGTIRQPGLKPKDLCLIPERLAIALQDDGWWVRQRIAWCKTAPMPESAEDRPACAWEHIWLLTKAEHYFYDSEAVKEPSVSDHRSGNGYQREERLTYRDADGPRGNRSGWDDIGGRRNLRNYWVLNPEPYPDARFAVFPSQVPLRAIKAGTSEGGIVLDPFAGSGTTLAVARRLGRRAVGIELQADYLALIKKRVAAGSLPLLELIK